MRNKGILTIDEKKTFVIHLIYSFLEGMILGVFALNEFIFSKSLKATDLQVGILFLFVNFVLIFSIFFDEFLKRYKNKKKLLLWVAILTRLPMFGFVLFPKDLGQLLSTELYHILFLVIFFIYFMAKPVVLPIINLYLKNSYSHENFSRLFSYSTVVNNIVMIVFTFFFGKLMDIDFNWYRLVYPLTGVLSILSIVLLASLKLNIRQEVVRHSLKISVRNSIQNSIQILRNNRPYRDFEIGFMLYGFAWMVSFAIVPIFWNKVLLLNNTGAAFYKNFYYVIAIFTLPVFGKLMGKLDPRKFAVISFSFMLFTIVFTALTEYWPFFIEYKGIKLYLFLILSNIMYGLFAGTMPLLWGIGSAYFCEKQDAASYQAVHLSMVGLRAAFSPLIGIFLLHAFNYTVTFGIGAFTLLLGIFVMHYSMKKYRH